MVETVFVPSQFKVTKEIKRPSKQDSNDLWSGLSNKKQTEIEHENKEEYSDCIVDGDALSVDTKIAIETLVSKGLKIVSITPITSGQYEYRYGRGEGVSYGYSYTEGVMIVAI